MEKLNLLHTVLNLRVGGLERLVYEIAMKMRDDIFNVEICCFNLIGDFGEALQEKGIPVTLLQKNQKHFDVLYPLKLMRFLRRKKVHILHMHSGTFFFGALAARLAGIPVTVYTDHGRPLNESRIHVFEDRIAAMFVDKIAAVSDQLRIDLLRKVKLPERKVTTVLNGVSTEKFAPRGKPLSLLKEFGIEADCKVIGTVGRMRAVKDHITLIKAFQLVSKKIPHSVLMLVGEGVLRKTLEEYVSVNNLKDRVIFTGIRKDIASIFNLFDLFVLSSLSEGTNVSLLEAMASGLPAVVTDVGGNPEIVDDGVNGILVKPKNVTQLADAVIEVLLNEREYERLRQNAINKVKRYYSFDAMVEKYRQIYLEFWEKGRGNYKRERILNDNFQPKY